METKVLVGLTARVDWRKTYPSSPTMDLLLWTIFVTGGGGGDGGSGTVLFLSPGFVFLDFRDFQS